MTAVTPERGEGLKPCPLCGGEARLGLTNRVERKDTLSAFCVDCSCMLSRTGPPHSEVTKRQVADAWNTRPAPSPATDEVVGDERDAFEAWYATDMASAGLPTARPGEIKALRKGDTYGARASLNGKWAGWKARSLLASMKEASR